ncbi:MAG: hypothetical protein P8184_12035, partial [Calditrichia bacterium]
AENITNRKRKRNGNAFIIVSPVLDKSPFNTELESRLLHFIPFQIFCSQVFFRFAYCSILFYNL